MIKNKRILAITLARGGSKSIKNKNIAIINGKPLIYYTIKEVKKSKYIDDYVVSTDDQKIKKVCEKYNIKIPFLRPKKFSGDKSPAQFALKHATIFFEKLKNIKYDYIIEIMATNPLKTIKDIDKCIEILDKKKSDSVISVCQLYDHHPARIKKIENGYLKNFCIDENEYMMRQDFTPKAYIRNGSIYAFKRNILINNNSKWGKKIIPYIMPDKRSINIDEPIDIEYCKLRIK
jgi:CMP-N,N'-diacetyllegionaminic acid synthase